MGKGGEFGEGGGEFRKKCKRHICHAKLNQHRKFHPNRTMGKYSKIGGMVFGKFGGGKKGGISKEKMQTSQMPSENESM